MAGKGERRGRVGRVAQPRRSPLLSSLAAVCLLLSPSASLSLSGLPLQGVWEALGEVSPEDPTLPLFPGPSPRGSGGSLLASPSAPREYLEPAVAQDSDDAE